MSNGLLTGHVLLADWLWLIAAVLLVVDAAALATARTAPAWLVPLALAITVVGFLVL